MTSYANPIDLTQEFEVIDLTAVVDVSFASDNEEFDVNWILHTDDEDEESEFDFGDSDTDLEDPADPVDPEDNGGMDVEDDNSNKKTVLNVVEDCPICRDSANKFHCCQGMHKVCTGCFAKYLAFSGKEESSTSECVLYSWCHKKYL